MRKRFFYVLHAVGVIIANDSPKNAKISGSTIEMTAGEDIRITDRSTVGKLDGVDTNVPAGSVTGSGASYNVAVSGMTGSGTVIATIAAGKAHDTAGNANAVSTSTDNTVTYDVLPPVFSAIAASPALAK